MRSYPLIICSNFLLVASLSYIDYVTGYDLGFFVFYFIPVSIVAWKTNWGWAVLFSLTCATAWGLIDWTSHHSYSHYVYYYWNAAIRFVAFLLLAQSLHKIRTLLQQEKTLVGNLSQALNEVKLLKGYLPICASCKKIRNDNGYWEQIEKYIVEHSQAEFTHGICPECSKRLYSHLLPSDDTTAMPPKE